MIKTQTEINKRSLPPGWRWAQLKEVAKVFAGSSAPQDKTYFDPNGRPFVRVSDLGIDKRTTCLTRISDHLSEKALQECSLVLAKGGTTVFPKSGAAVTTNNRAILGVDAYIVSHLMGVEPIKNIITPLWLYWSLCQIDMVLYSDNIAYPSLKQSNVSTIRIPLPPINEQQRLEAILKKQMSEIEKAKSAAEVQLEAAKALPASYLREVFNSPEAQKWPKKLIGELCEVSTGTTPSRTRPKYFGNGIAWVTPGDFDDDSMYIENGRESLTELGISEGRGRIFPTGTVLLVCIGATIGKVAIAKRNISANQQINAIKCSVSILPEFLYFHLKFDKADFIAAAASATLPIVNQQRLKQRKTPLPTMIEQKRIVQGLVEKMKAAKNLFKKLETKLAVINKLPAAILCQAFNGEI